MSSKASAHSDLFQYQSTLFSVAPIREDPAILNAIHADYENLRLIFLMMEM